MPIKRGEAKKNSSLSKKSAASRPVSRIRKVSKRPVVRKTPVKRIGASLPAAKAVRRPISTIATPTAVAKGRKALALVCGVLLLASSILAPFFVMAAWQNPGGNPPSSNAPDPINTANTAQTKQGTMWISSGNAYQSNPNTYGFIVQNGRVGIGSTTPGVLMAVDAGAGVAAINVGGGRITNLNEIPLSWSEAASRYYVDYRVSQATSSYTYWRPNGTHIYSNNAGNVGVGTTTPDKKFTVALSVADNIAKFANRNTTAGSNFGVLVAAGSNSSDYGLSVRNRNYNGYYLYVRGDGNVGIGTNAPGALLEVNGANPFTSIQSSANGYTYTRYGNTTANSYIGQEGSAGAAILAGTAAYTMVMNQANAYPIQFGTSNVIRMTILSNGNIGIATTSPGTLLSVDGASGGNRVYLGDGRISGVTEVPISNNEAASKYYVDARTGGAGGIPGPGTLGNTMRSNGTDWIATSNLYNNGTFIGIGTTTVNGVLSTDGNVRVSGTLGVTNMIEDAIDSRLDVNDDLYVAGGNIQTNSGNDYAKYCMWGAGDTNYCIGAYSAQTFGYLNDYSMAFTMSNVAARGWSWRDTADAASDAAMSLTTDGRLAVKSTSWFQGSVGIASSTPGAALSVDGGGSATRVYLGEGRILGLTEVPISRNEAASKYYVDQASGFGIPTPVGVSGYTLRSNGTNWVSNSLLYNNGTNIGIGTNNPSAATLVVNGTLRTNGNITNYDAPTGGNHIFSFTRQSNDLSISSYDAVAFKANATTGPAGSGYDMYIDNGNVGIGNTVPQSRLDLGTGTGAKLLWYNDNNTGPLAGTKGGIYLDQFSLSNNTTVVYPTAAANPGTFIFASKDTGGVTLVERVRLTGQTGYLGIGTNNPSTYLDVNGGTGEVTDMSAGQINNVANADDSNDAINLGQADGRYAPIGSAMPAPGTNGNTLRSNGTNWVANSAIFNNGTNVAIGDGTIYGDVRFNVSGSNGSNDSTFLTVKRDGTTNPVFAILPWDGQVYLSAGIYYSNGSWVHNSDDTNNNMFLMDPGVGTTWYASNNSTGSWNVASNVSLWDDGARWKSSVQSTRAENSYFTGGNVAIGTTNPGTYRLYVSGSARITGYLDLNPGDISEYFVVDEDYPVGTVLVMAEGKAKSVTACSQEYDKKVVGVISSDPAVKMGESLGIEESDKKAPIAMTGVVPVRVNNANGNIEKGDFLTTSSIIGEAMKSSEAVAGSIIGKALEDMSDDDGSILVLINLQ